MLAFDVVRPCGEHDGIPVAHLSVPFSLSSACPHARTEEGMWKPELAMTAIDWTLARKRAPCGRTARR